MMSSVDCMLLSSRNKLLHTALEPTTNKSIAHALFIEFREKQTSMTTPEIEDFWCANKTHSASLTPCFSLMARTH